MTRNLMIFGQGAFLAHPYVLKEMQAAKDNDAKAALSLGLKHVFSVACNKARSFFMGITNGALTSSPRSGADKQFYQRINRLSAAFSYSANVTMIILQSRLMKLERTSALLGDALSNLYMASQVLRRWDYEGRKEADAPLMQWAASFCLHRAETALYDVIENHPSKLAKWMLKPVVFPLGRRMHKPSHHLDAKVADLISTPGETRDRLTANMFMPKEAKEYVARLERTLVLCQKAYPHEQTLYRAVKKGQLSQSENYERMVKEAGEKNIIDADVVTLLMDTYKARTDIVEVDHFPHDWHGAASNPNQVRNLSVVA
jgi:hypothetical protein